MRNGKEYLEIHLNKETIKTKGKDAIGMFLKLLQLYKSSANFKEGSKFFSKYLEVYKYFIVGWWKIVKIQRNCSQE